MSNDIVVPCRLIVNFFQIRLHFGVLCGAVYYSVLQCVAVCCGVLQCGAVYCSVLQCDAVLCSVLQCVAVWYSVLQCVAVCCSVLQCVAVCCRLLPCVAVCCSVFQCVTVCCICHRHVLCESRSFPPGCLFFWQVCLFYKIIKKRGCHACLHQHHHVKRMDVLWHAYGWVMSHIWMSHVKHMND